MNNNNNDNDNDNDNDKVFLPLITYRTKQNVVIPILFVSLVSILLSWFYGKPDTVASIIPSDNDDVGLQTLEGVLLVLFSIVSGILIVFILKRNKHKILKILFSISIILSTISMMWVHGFLITSALGLNTIWIEVFFIILGTFFGFFCWLVIIEDFFGHITRNICVMVLGIIYGIIFGLMLNVWAFIVFIFLLSLFDIYSVFKGPIHKILEKRIIPNQLPTDYDMMKYIEIGIGDFILYSAMIAFAFTELNFVVAILTVISICVGVLITMTMVKKYQKFPGLPLPVLFTLLVYLLGYLLIRFTDLPLL